MRRSNSIAVFDACVLYPAPLRDFLMWLSITGCVRARWSTQIHQEWQRNLLKNRPDLSVEQLTRTSELMNQALPDALVTGHETLISDLRLPDADDRHVLAAAIQCKAKVIVTFNVKDFPVHVLHAFGVEAQHPDAFIVKLLSHHTAAAVSAAQRQRKQLKHPTLPVDQFLKILLNQGLVQTVDILTRYRAIL